jgi:hypothetical protein
VDEVAAVLEAVGVPSRRRQSPAREVSPTLLPLARLEGSCVIQRASRNRVRSLGFRTGVLFR